MIHLSQTNLEEKWCPRRCTVWAMLALCGLLIAGVARGQELSKAEMAFTQGYAFHVGDGIEKDLEKALLYYRQALKFDPNMYEAHSNAGKAYYALEKYQNAKSHYGKAIEISRANPDISAEEEARVTADLATCYFQTDQIRESERWLQAAIRKYPGLVEAHYNLINLLFKQDRRDEAKLAMERASQLAPSQRYDILTGRLEGKESWDEWNPLWVKVILVALVVGVIAMFALRAVKSNIG